MPEEPTLPAPYAPRIIVVLIVLAAVVAIVADIINDGKGYQARGYYPYELRDSKTPS